MLSICIPVYNFDVRALVEDLSVQLSKAGFPFEILLMDDASDVVFRQKNQESESKNIRYIQLSENIGRSKIRNELARTAKYDYLIFMDCDSKVPSKEYINNYLPYCRPMTVCYGGRIYEKNPPCDSTFLRWKYGVERESQPASKRKENANYGFCTNNFLIHKAIFEILQFDEKLEGYGHEDTLFGLELMTKGIKIKHTDNPLIHIGLEDASVFLSKTENAVSNLSKINNLIKEKYPTYTNHSKLTQSYCRINRLGMKKWLARLFRIMRPYLKRNLLGKNPSLRVFDLYKLGFLLWLNYNLRSQR